MKKVGTFLSTIYRIKKSLKEQGRVKRDQGSERKPSVVAPRLVTTTKSHIDGNPIRSMKRVLKVLNVSEPSVRRVVKENIGTRSLARTKMYFLIDCLKALRLIMLSQKKNILTLIQLVTAEQATTTFSSP